MTPSVREAISCRNLVESVRKSVVASQVLVVSTLPRGDLQVAQPPNVSDSLLKAYAAGYHAQDRLTWQAILRQQPLTPADCWSGDDFVETPYVTQWMQPLGLTHVMAFPIRAPLLAGYPGVLHVARTAEQGPFTPAEVKQISDLIEEFDERLSSHRDGKRGSGDRDMQRPDVRLTIVDAQQNVIYPAASTDLDDRFRTQMLEYGRRRAPLLNGDGMLIDRLLISDSHGDNWTFRLVTYRSYPAVGEGAITFFCLQPDCQEWSQVKVNDLSADPELSRLIPAMKFMQQEFNRGPTLIDIAKEVGLSPFHFHRRFTELLGLTPKQFLLECQINKAKSDLIGRQKELAEIARECGFAHQSHFTSRFKQATGLTPTRWRRLASERYQSA